MSAAVEAPVTLRYLGFKIALLDDRHVTIIAPDGYRIVAGVRMTIAAARSVVRGYRAEERLERLYDQAKAKGAVT